MPQGGFSSLPLVPWDAVGVLVMICLVGALVALMRDWGTRDTSIATGIGMVLVSIAIMAVIGAGAYNFGIAVAKLAAQHQEELASAAPQER